MTKKRESLLKNWDEVDVALKEIGELEIKKNRLQGDMTMKINKIESKYIDSINAIDTKITSNQKKIEDFCNQNKSDFLNKRSKKLNYGVIKYRLIETIIVGCTETTIRALKTLNLDSCLRIKEELNKDELKKLGNSTLAKIGVKISRADKLTIKPNFVEIATKIGGNNEVSI